MAWNRPNAEKKAAAKKRGGQWKVRLRGLVAACIVVLGAGIAAWLLWPDASAPVRESADGTVDRKAKPTVATPVSSVTTPASSVAVQGKVATEPLAVAGTNEVAAEKKPGVFAPGMIRLPNGFELRFKLPKEGETRQLLAGGEIWEIDSQGNIENITPPPIFEKPFEGMLSALFERDGMVLPFALKNYSEEEIRKMCKEPTLTYDDDTPEITRKRENVVMLKKAVLDFLDGGGKFEEFVDDMQQHSQNSLRAQSQGFHDIRDLLAAGKGQEALQYYKTYSQEMSDKGYGELKLPPSFKAALEEQQRLEDAKQ